MQNVILIGDPRVKAIVVQENNDPMVDLRHHFPQLRIDNSRKHVQQESRSISHARLTVGRMLLEAQQKLPSGLHLLIKECHRPMHVQRKSWESYEKHLQKTFPTWTQQQIDEENSKLNAPLDVAPHTTGAAVDLTLTTDDGTWLEMGTLFNASPLETENRTYTHATNISTEAAINRKHLVKTMTEAGFVNYPTEWWHWSYGDKYWALAKNHPHALFGTIDEHDL